MKRFQDLNSEQKKQAVDYLFKREMRNVRWNGAGQPTSVQDRLKEIREKIKFCGCTDCDIKLFSEVQKDSVIKEVQLDRALKQADEAFYPEDADIIVKV
jgi:hypothetical protein